MNEWLKGRILAKNIQEKLKARIKERETLLGLGVVLVGDDKASHLYVDLKEKAAKEAGIFVERKSFAESTTETDVIQAIQELNERSDIHGILVQLPLPEALNEETIIQSIHPDKDVDGFLTENLEKLQAGEAGLVPPVALSIMRLIQDSHQPLRGKSALIVSNSEIFSKPLLALMKEVGIEGTWAGPDASAFAAKTRAADILIVAVGQKGLIQEDMVKEGSIIIDVGTNRVGDKVFGDVTRAAKAKAAFASPVPGGVGPLTVAYLLNNVLKASELQRRNNRNQDSTQE